MLIAWLKYLMALFSCSLPQKIPPASFLPDKYICLVPISVQFCNFHEGICVGVTVGLVWDSTLWTSVNEWIWRSWIIYYLECLKLFMNILVLFHWETQIYTSGFKFLLFICLKFSFHFFYSFLLSGHAYPLSKGTWIVAFKIRICRHISQ